MSDKIYSLLATVITLCGTFFLPWWSIPTLIFVAAMFYKGSKLKAAGIATGIATMIWVSIAGIKDGMASEKAASLIAGIFGNIAPSLIFTLTGLIIGTVTGMAATSGKLVAGYFSKD